MVNIRNVKAQNAFDINLVLILLLFFLSLVGAGTAFQIGVSPSRLEFVHSDFPLGTDRIEKEIILFNPNDFAIAARLNASSQTIGLSSYQAVIAPKSSAIITAASSARCSSQSKDSKLTVVFSDDFLEGGFVQGIDLALIEQIHCRNKDLLYFEGFILATIFFCIMAAVVIWKKRQ